MTLTVKDKERVNSLSDAAARAVGDDRQSALKVIDDAARALRRISSRAEVPEDLERFEIKQAKGPTIEFTGTLLCRDAFTTEGRDPYRIRIELYLTRANAYVAVSSSEPIEWEGHEVVRAVVVPPSDDEQARRYAVLDAFEWHVRARSMVSKRLKWSLREEVE